MSDSNLEDDADSVPDGLDGLEIQVQSLIQVTSGTVVHLAPDGTIQFVDDSVTSLLGFEPEELLGDGFGSLVAEDEMAGTILGAASPVELLAGLTDAPDSGSIALPVRTAAGQTETVSLSAAALDTQDGYLCVLEPDEEGPVTETETELVDAVGDPLYVLDETGAIERVNDAMISYTGYRRDELVGRAIDEILPSPEYSNAASRHSSQSTQTDTTDTFETTLVTKDGQLIDSEAKVTALTDDDGEYAGAVGVLRDIRGRKQRERDLELLKQVLTRVFRHNVRNELTVIQTNTELLDRRTEGPLTEYTDEILDTCQRLLAHSEKARLMEQVIDTTEREEIDIAETVRSLAVLAREASPESTIEVDVSGPTYVKAHPDISKAIEELIENAITHAPESESPTVRIWIDEMESFRTLFIEDESGGLADHEIEVLQQAEESDLEHGSGVGLWLVRWLVEHSNAKMVAHQTEEGSLMGIRFPRHDAEEADSVVGFEDTAPFARAPPHVQGLSPERFRGETVVGRMEELHRLEDTYDAVVRTGGHAVFVTGEAGVGKSTLLEQFRSRLAEREDPPLLATGNCESTMARPYHALHEALSDLPVETELEQALTGMLSPVSADPDQAKQRKQALFADVAETLRDLAIDHPVVVVIEDLQWADPGTIDLFQYLIDEVGQWALPILFVGSFRSEEIDDEHPIVEVGDQTVETGRGTVLELTPFGPTDVRNLLSYMIDVADIPDSFVQTVQEHTGGTPLFVAEIGRQLAETVGSAGDQTELPESIGEISLPETVESAVDERIDALSSPVRAVLDLGAVAGDSTSFDVLRSASNRSETKLVESVDRLVRKHIWVQTGDQLSFVHGIVREKTLEQIDGERWDQLNRRVARAIEQVHADSLEAQYGRLATHYDEAGDTDRAIEYYSLAGEQAADAYAHEDAIEFYERAITLADGAEPETLARLHGDLAEVHRTVGELDSARATGQTGVSVAAPESLQLCRLLSIVAEVQTGQGDLDQATTATERQRDLAARLDRPAMEAQAVRRLGVIAKNRGSFDRAREYYERALALADDGAERELVATVQKELGIVAWRQGAYDTAHQSFEESLRIAREVGARSLEAACLNNLGGVKARQGEYDQSRKYHEQSLAIKREIGDRKGEAYSLNNLGEILLSHGNYGQARAYYQESLAIKREIGDSRGQAETLLNLGIAARYQGEYDQAREYHEDGLAAARQTGGRLREARNLVNLGKTARLCREYEEARDHFEDAMAIARELDNPVVEIDALRGLGVAALEQDSYDRAREQFDEALRIGTEREHPAETAQTRLESARLALRTGSYETAQERVEMAAEMLESLGVRLWHARCQIVQGRIHAAQDAGEAALDHWEAALDTFEEIDATRDVLSALYLLIEHHREQNETERARELCQRAQTRLATAPEPVASQYEGPIQRHASALGLS